MLKYLLIILFCLGCFSSNAEELEVSFGLVIKNVNGEPVGFKETTDIPLVTADSPTVYGFVVTRKDDTPFWLGAIHIVPSSDPIGVTKIMGKPMKIVKRGAIFLQTAMTDKRGIYQVEIYIDNQLFQIIDYNVVSPIES